MSRLAEIETFVQIAQSGSISRAAEVMRIAKSAASRRLADLEARLGVQLFHRTTRQMSLTDAGALFLERASRIIDDLAEAEAAASEGATALSGNLKVTAPLAFGMSELKCVIAEFACTHPKVVLEIDFSERLVDIVGEGFDVAVRIAPLADSSLIARKLCPIRVAVAASPKFWDKHGRPTHPSDLQSLDCIRYSNVARPGVLSYTAPNGETGAVEPPIRLLANNGEFLTEMVTHAGGFLVEPTFLLYKHLRSGEMEAVLTEYSWSNAYLHVLYPPTRQPSARVRAFADAIIEKFNNNPYWDEGIF